MRTRSQCLRFALALLIAACAHAGAHADALPRYRLEPGRHLRYEGNELAVTQSGRVGVDRTAEIIVVSANDDGSARTIVSQTTRRFMERNGEMQRMPERTNTYVVDVFPDGRIADRGKDSYGLLNRLLPRLPADETEADRGWRFRSADVTVTCGPLAADGTPAFDLTPTSDMWLIHLFAAKFRYEIDPKVGFVTGISGQHRARDRDTRKETETLVADDRLDAATLAALAAEIDDAVRVRLAYRKAVADALVSGDPSAGMAAVESAHADVVRTRDATTSARLRTDLDRLVAEHTDRKGGLDRQIAINARILGRPAPAWSLTDFDGNDHHLTGYAGKVIVLDFWYKNCGWCIRAMPQLRELARRFEGRPVAVLGMNVDTKEADARYVAERLDFTYPNLFADRELARSYGVQAYPTLLVVDGAGIVRHVHRGYSWKLADELAEIIEGLLDPADASGPGRH
jgi:peroxiredoxin